MGLEGVSVRDIAQKAKVNIAMISYYFGGKEGLYLECISHFAQTKLDNMKLILKPAENGEEFKARLRMLVEHKMHSFAEDSHTHKIIMREMQTKRNSTFQKKVMSQLFPLFDLMHEFFMSAKKKKLLKSDVDPQHLTIMMMGILSHPCLAEDAIKIHLGYSMSDPKARDKYIENVCLVFFSGIIK